MGTFQFVNGRKQGGNVATYFCTADGRVLHAIAGPVDGRTLLHEAKWVLDIHEKAKQAGKEEEAEFAKFVRQAHAERVKDSGKSQQPADRRADSTNRSPLSADVHRLLAAQAGNEIEKVYTKVWEGILKEKASDHPLHTEVYPR